MTSAEVVINCPDDVHLDSFCSSFFLPKNEEFDKIVVVKYFKDFLMLFLRDDFEIMMFYG